LVKEKQRHSEDKVGVIQGTDADAERGSDLLSRGNEGDAKGQSIQVLEKVWQANRTYSGSTHILYSAGGEMTSLGEQRPVAQLRCGPLANGWALFAESARGDPPVGSWRWGPGGPRCCHAARYGPGTKGKNVPHPTETRPAESIRGLPLLHRSCARSHGPLGEGKAYPGYSDSAGVLCREKHQLTPRGVFHVPSAVSLHLDCRGCSFCRRESRLHRCPVQLGSLRAFDGMPGHPSLSKKKTDQSIRTHAKILVVPTPPGEKRGRGMGMGNGGTPHGRCRRQHQVSGLFSSTP
jgi:hypothetical protein